MIQHLDKDSDISNLHLHFLLEYATYLGIGIDDTDHPEWFESPPNRTIRQQRLRELTNYYEEHIEDFRPPKSLEVLIEVFNWLLEFNWKSRVDIDTSLRIIPTAATIVHESTCLSTTVVGILGIEDIVNLAQ